MDEKEVVIERIRGAFQSEFPGKHFLQGSYEGSEPYEEVGPFQDREDWNSIEPGFLDTHHSALSFFSEGAFRYFLPAYLIADVKGQLETADPLFHLIGGFYDFAVKLPTSQRTFEVKSGKSSFVNPRRYGALTAFDYARYRLSVFTREEASAIVAYLRYKHVHDEEGYDMTRIQAALDLFWLDREQNAPTAESLQQHLVAQQEYLAAVHDGKPELFPGAGAEPAKKP